MNLESLTSLLYFLAFGVFFYWMMKKGGCGMHGHGGHGAHGGHGHGHDGHGHDGDMSTDARHGDVASASAKDPVCGMALNPRSAAATRSVAGRDFYFCSPKCVEKFDGDPEGFTRRAPAQLKRPDRGIATEGERR